MGTRGYRVYRHRGRYHVTYNHYDSYPSNYGVNVLSQVPPPPHFEEWAAEMRKYLDVFFEKSEQGTLPESDEFALPTRPAKDPLIEWVYEIDLDRLVFHINSSPMFRLDHLPPGDDFEDYITHDDYGNIATSLDTPKEYRYDWKAPPPLAEQSLIDAYHSVSHGAVAVPIHELLATEQTLSLVESTWSCFLEAVIGNFMAACSVSIQEFEAFAGRTELDDFHRALCLTAVNSAFLAPFTPESSTQMPPFDLPEGDFWWAQADACILVTTHLDDERNMQAAVAELQQEAMGKAGTPEVVYGVAASLQHVVVMRVDKAGRGAVQHTPALQFFPSFFTVSPSTPGITALARLGRYTQPHIHIPSEPMGHPSRYIPEDIMREIATHLTDARDLRNFAMLSVQAFAATKPYLQYPHFGEYFLRSPQPHRYSLVRAKFDTFAKGRPAVIELQGFSSVPSRLRLNCFKPLEYEIPVALNPRY
ncbi:hypothetical protein BOTBODRAFT_436042 [Botryobasidium botryosum FD-172 SS1]|uniref:Uncharacterized protein n=1 Tax=Botryobasidium botryosum (strain FD-172 SS1) TaxID=930990 RepID=A0A067N6G4_BOTB1|nr:hypothetical protein BOTBODRAFT_436042 [Botryobasidium botryosum FD-172 SS1]